MDHGNLESGGFKDEVQHGVTIDAGANGFSGAYTHRVVLIKRERCLDLKSRRSA